MVRLLLASGADREVLTLSGKSAAATAATRDIARLLALDQVSEKAQPVDGPTAAPSAKSQSSTRPADKMAKGHVGGKQTQHTENPPTTPNRLMDYFVVLKQSRSPCNDKGRQVP